MRILYILHNKSIEGSLISFLNLAEEMRKKNVEIHIAVPPLLYNNTEFVNRVNSLNITIHIVPVIPSTLIKGLCKKNSFFKMIRIIYGIIRRKIYSFYRFVRIIRKIKPDIVHTNTGVIHEGFWASKVCRIPHIWHLREYQDLDFYLSPLMGMNSFKRLLRKSEVISITKDILFHFNLENHYKAQTIYNGVCSQNDTVYKKRKEKYFLCASRISVEKGHHIVVRAFSLFNKKHPDYHMYIAGEGDPIYIKEIKEIIKDCDCSRSIIFLGFQSDIKSLMSHAKALIVASRNEGFGRMTAEAAFYGCLTIGHNTGGTKEILEEIGGFPYEGGINALNDKMEEIVSLSEKQYHFMALQAQKRAKILYSIEKSGEQIYSVYEKVVRRSIAC